ncbi:F-box and associated interaction domains-containing protein [Striga asiatica]|uniref:F-box and associated interaction domains-containing protein n=1 Tax=Striga asiatica TaxID=4170 RepID=A0A5A7R6G9_STRAF|nr:F-box and associated interaction domains-containing protein [Striga asiatica]
MASLNLNPNPLLKPSSFSVGRKKNPLFNFKPSSFPISLNKNNKSKLNLCKTFSITDDNWLHTSLFQSKRRSKFIIAEDPSMEETNYVVVSIDKENLEPTILTKIDNPFPDPVFHPYESCKGLILLLYDNTWNKYHDDLHQEDIWTQEALWNPTTNELKILPTSPATLDPSEPFSRIHVNGTYYWLNNLDDYFIQSFNFSTEKFESYRVPMPPSEKLEKFCDKRLVEYWGSLGFLASTTLWVDDEMHNALELWVWDDVSLSWAQESTCLVDKMSSYMGLFENDKLFYLQPGGDLTVQDCAMNTEMNISNVCSHDVYRLMLEKGEQIPISASVHGRQNTDEKPLCLLPVLIIEFNEKVSMKRRRNYKRKVPYRRRSNKDSSSGQIRVNSLRTRVFRDPASKPVKPVWVEVQIGSPLFVPDGTTPRTYKELSPACCYDVRCSRPEIGYSDSDFAGCLDSRKSTFGYVFLLAEGAISWKSAKQSVIAASTMEAEFVACFDILLVFPGNGADFVVAKYIFTEYSFVVRVFDINCDFASRAGRSCRVAAGHPSVLNDEQGSQDTSSGAACGSPGCRIVAGWLRAGCVLCAAGIHVSQSACGCLEVPSAPLAGLTELVGPNRADHVGSSDIEERAGPGFLPPATGMHGGCWDGLGLPGGCTPCGGAVAWIGHAAMYVRGQIRKVPGKPGHGERTLSFDVNNIFVSTKQTFRSSKKTDAR